MGRRLFSGLELSLIGVVVAVIVGAALIGPGDDGAGREPAPDHAQPPATGGAVDVASIKRRVERLRGLRFRRRLRVIFASPGTMRSLLRAAAREEGSGEREQRTDEEALKLLGLLSPAESLGEATRAIEREQVLGFYDFRSKRLVVRRRATDTRGLQEITLSHELTHALEDQHFDLRPMNGLGDDGALAEAALFEGTATALMSDYAERYLDLDDLLGVLEGIAGTETELPRFVERQLIFPYEAGEHFIATYRQRGSWSAVDQVMRLRRPRSTEQVIHPEKYAANEAPVRSGVGDIARRLGPDWRRVGSSTVGELDLRLWFRLAGNVSRPGEAAGGWGGGRFELWRQPGMRSCPAPCIARDAGLVRLAWDSSRDRREGERALSRVFERGLRGNRTGVRQGSLLWASRGGAIGLRGRGLQTVVVLAPSAELAVRLLR